MYFIRSFAVHSSAKYTDKHTRAGNQIVRKSKLEIAHSTDEMQYVSVMSDCFVCLFRAFNSVWSPFPLQLRRSCFSVCRCFFFFFCWNVFISERWKFPSSRIIASKIFYCDISFVPFKNIELQRIVNRKERKKNHQTSTPSWEKKDEEGKNLIKNTSEFKIELTESFEHFSHGYCVSLSGANTQKTHANSLWIRF